MIAYLVVAIYLMACLFALVYPQKALGLFWVLILCYPTWLLYGKLPLNIGLDDIFLVCLFVGSLVKGKVSEKWPFMAALFFCILAVFGDLSSIGLGSNIDISYALKRWLKNAGLICLVFSVSATIHNERDIKRALYAMLAGMVLGGVLLIYYAINKSAYNPFQIPAWALGKEESLLQVIGPFSSHDRAGGILGFGSVIAYFMIKFTRSKGEKIFLVSICCILMLALLLSASRSGWVFLVFPVMLSSFLGKKKLVGIVMLVLVTLFALFALAKFAHFSERLTETTEAYSAGGLEVLSSGRIKHWKTTLSHPSVSWLLFGEGFAAQEFHPHSNYIAMLKCTGLIGIAFWAVFYTRIFKKSFWLMNHDYLPEMTAVFSGCFWAYIGYLIYFIPSTPMMWSPVRYTDFFLMTLIHLRYRQLVDSSCSEEYSVDELPGY